MLQVFNVADFTARLAEALVVGVVAYSFRLSHRVTRAENNISKAEEKIKERGSAMDNVTKELASVSAASDQLTALMVKVDTLLETGLKRIDMLEKHVFKM